MRLDGGDDLDVTRRPQVPPDTAPQEPAVTSFARLTRLAGVIETVGNAGLLIGSCSIVLGLFMLGSNSSHDSGIVVILVGAGLTLFSFLLFVISALCGVIATIGGNVDELTREVKKQKL